MKRVFLRLFSKIYLFERQSVGDRLEGRAGNRRREEEGKEEGRRRARREESFNS